jgi:thioredoxin-related protein
MCDKFSRLTLLVTIAFVFGLSWSIVSLSGECGEAAQVQAEGANGRLNWQTSLAAAANQAAQEHKYVLADVYTDWCGWCKKLDKDVFPNSAVVNYLQKDFVCVKVNAEDPREGAMVAKAYKVNGFPCALVFSPEGKLLGRVGGYTAASGYIATLQQITGRTNQVQAVEIPQDRQFGQQPQQAPQQQQGQQLQPVQQLQPALPLQAEHHGGGRVHWQTSFSAGRDLALQHHKYVLADMYTERCGICKRLDKDVFTDSAVANYLQNGFVCVKLNPDNHGEAESVAREYTIQGVPTALVFSPEGKFLGRFVGYQDPSGYIAMLQRITGSENHGQFLGMPARPQSQSQAQPQPQPQPLSQDDQMQKLQQLQQQWQQQNQQQPPPQQPQPQPLQPVMQQPQQ